MTTEQEPEVYECVCADVDPWVGLHENPDCPGYTPRSTR